MAGTFLDLTGLKHFKAKLFEQIDADLSDFAKKSDLSDIPNWQKCSDVRDRDSSKPTYGLK